MFHQPISRLQPPSKLNTLSLEEIQLTTQVASSHQALHQSTETKLKETQKHTKDI